MDEFLAKYDEVEFISGGSSGVDQLAFEYAKENFLPIKIYFANWKRYQKLERYKRNKRIWQEADLGIAFWDGKSKGDLTHSSLFIPEQVWDSRHADLTL